MEAIREVIEAYFAVWNEQDPAVRDHLLERAWTDDGVLTTPRMGRVSGLSRTGPAHDPRADGRAARGCTRRAEVASELAVQTAVDPCILGLAPHPLYVGRQITRPRIATSPTYRLIDNCPTLRCERVTPATRARSPAMHGQPLRTRP
jgi:hypothetical protein